MRGVSKFLQEVCWLTEEELLITLRTAYEAHPDTAAAGGDDPLPSFLLDQIAKAFDPSRPVQSAREALNGVILGAFVMMNALYEI